MTKAKTSWLSLSFKAAQLGLESQTVIGLRLMRLGFGGPAAVAEAERMVTEKAWTALEAQAEFAKHALMGRPDKAAAHTLSLYRRRVCANRRRLTKSL